MKTFIYVTMCLIVPPVWGVITYFAFSFLQEGLKRGEGGADPRAAE